MSWICAADAGVTALVGQDRRATRQSEGHAGASRDPASIKEELLQRYSRTDLSGSMAAWHMSFVHHVHVLRHSCAINVCMHNLWPLLCILCPPSCVLAGALIHDGLYSVCSKTRTAR